MTVAPLRLYRRGVRLRRWLPVPGVIMRKIHLLLFVLFSGLCLACQRTRRRPAWSGCHGVLAELLPALHHEPTARSSSRKRAAVPSPRPRPTPCSGRCGPGMPRYSTESIPGLMTISPGPGARRPPAGLALGPAPGRLLGGAGCQQRHRRRPGLRPGPGPGAPQGWRAPPGLPDYLEESRRVQADILAKEVVSLPGGDVLLTPGNWHEPSRPTW